ncbi:MAG: hypothetical protein LAT68_07255 [Cyclobacteriaceae bacterium]|nr:hypothetical protein [Cyclobacteriaceae bacterium]MCH8516112.1 hypothetical protein [Cyclobacteriaceae bacterium]
MKTLNNNWVTEGWIDFEYKKYILLAYLEHLRNDFKKPHLFPGLQELVAHYRQLKQMHESKEQILNSFPKRLTKADFENFKLHYEKIVQDDDTMKRIEAIVQYALPQMEQTLKEGKDIYDFIEKQISVHEIGISTLYKDEGYMMLHAESSSFVNIYQYRVSVFHQSEDSYRAIHCQFIQRVKLIIGRTFEKIKLDLIKNFSSLPNPYTVLVSSKFELPEQTTLLPIAKRSLIRYLSSA